MYFIAQDPYSRTPQETSSNVERVSALGDKVRKVAAAVEGAAEGLADSTEEYHIAETVGEAAAVSRDTVQQISDEARTQMQTPEGQAARDAAMRSRERVSETTTHARDAAGERWTSARTATQQQVEHVEERAREARAAAQHRAAEIREDVQETMEDVREKARAVQETANRARTAPGKVAGEMGSALKEAARGYGKWIAGLGVAGLIALDALVVLTIWLVVAMSSLVGFVLGSFLAGIVLLAVAGAAFFWGRGAKQGAGRRVNEGMEESRSIVRDVPEPVRRQFGGST